MNRIAIVLILLGIANPALPQEHKLRSHDSLVIYEKLKVAIETHDSALFDSLIAPEFVYEVVSDVGGLKPQPSFPGGFWKSVLQPLSLRGASVEFLGNPVATEEEGWWRLEGVNFYYCRQIESKDGEMISRKFSKYFSLWVKEENDEYLIVKAREYIGLY